MAVAATVWSVWTIWAVTLCGRWWSQWAWLWARRRWRLPGRPTNSPAYGWRITSFVPRLVILSCREGLLWSLIIRCIRYWTAQQCCGSGIFFMQVRFVKLMRIRILLLNFQTKCSKKTKSRPATLWINACIRTLFLSQSSGMLNCYQSGTWNTHLSKNTCGVLIKERGEYRLAVPYYRMSQLHPLAILDRMDVSSTPLRSGKRLILSPKRKHLFYVT